MFHKTFSFPTVLSRVNYDKSNWRLLAKTLLKPEEYQSIDIDSRIRLILDMFDLAKIGRLKYKIVFKIIKYVQHESSFFPWHQAMKKLNEFRIYLFGTDILKPYEVHDYTFKFFLFLSIILIELRLLHSMKISKFCSYGKSPRRARLNYFYIFSKL